MGRESWWTVEEATLFWALNRVADGEEPELVMMSLLANSRSSQVRYTQKKRKRSWL
jgi:hypothetical protein